MRCIVYSKQKRCTLSRTRSGSGEKDELSSDESVLMKVKRRNISSMRRRYETARGIVVSIPKSGRTWLRVFLHAYICEIQHRPFTLSESEIIASGLPDFVFTHDLWKHRTTAKWTYTIRGKHLVSNHAADLKPSKCRLAYLCGKRCRGGQKCPPCHFLLE